VPRCLDRENDAFILVVDDVVMAVVRLVICKLLRRAGHTVEEANHALARVAIRAPDAVVTDLRIITPAGFARHARDSGVSRVGRPRLSITP
jgi:CheY-like chemotaxis protein